MTTHSFDTLVEVVVASSISNSWVTAVREWEVIELLDDSTASGVCLCGQTGLVKLFTIQNQRNGSELHPIGSVCVDLFGREDLNRQVSLLSSLHQLRDAIRSRKTIELTSDYFSRAILEYLYNEGAFTGDQWNGGDGRRDYEFLRDMFNKRDKDAIWSAQRRKIAALLNRKVIPFVSSDPRLR